MAEENDALIALLRTRSRILIALILFGLSDLISLMLGLPFVNLVHSIFAPT